MSSSALGVSRSNGGRATGLDISRELCACCNRSRQELEKVRVVEDKKLDAGVEEAVVNAQNVFHGLDLSHVLLLFVIIEHVLASRLTLNECQQFSNTSFTKKCLEELYEPQARSYFPPNSL